MAPEDARPPGENPEEQVRQQTGQQQVRLRIDERNLESTYCNAFRTHPTADEVMIDFGINVVNPAQQEGGQPEIVLQLKDRVFMNFYTAKRLAITLSQVIRRHEEAFGELELDVNKRRTGQAGQGGSSS